MHAITQGLPRVAALILLVTMSAMGCKGAGDAAVAHVPAYPGNTSADSPDPIAAASVQDDQAVVAASHAVDRLPPPLGAHPNVRQTHCPVTGSELGSMGAPVPVATAKGTVYVCCAGCVEELRNNPGHYLGRGDMASLEDRPSSEFENSRKDIRVVPEPRATSCSSSASDGPCCH